MSLEVALVLSHILNDIVSSLTQVSASGEFPVSAGFIFAHKCIMCIFGTYKGAPYYWLYLMYLQ